MAEELRRSWKRTEGYLLDARAHLSEAAEGICADDIRLFVDFIENNELGLALDTLDDVLDQCGELESSRVLEFMALAAASMGQTERQRSYDEKLSKNRGWTYKTVLPSV